MAFVLVNFSWAFRADIKIPNVANWVTDEVHARIPGDPQPVLRASSPSRPLHLPHRCPSWWSPGALRLRWPTPWPPLPSAGSGWSRRFCCLRWSPAHLAIGNPGTFSKAGRGTEEGGDSTEVRADTGTPASPQESARAPVLRGWGHYWKRLGPQGNPSPADILPLGAGGCPVSAGHRFAVAEVPLATNYGSATAGWPGWEAACRLQSGDVLGAAQGSFACGRLGSKRTSKQQIGALLQLTSLASGCVHPARNVSYFSSCSRTLIARNRRRDYTFPECSILNNPTYSIGIK